LIALTDRSNGNVYKPRPVAKKSSGIQYTRLLGDVGDVGDAGDVSDVLNFFKYDYENIFEEDNEAEGEDTNGAPPGGDFINTLHS
jgi:hypothetical protein